MAINWKDEFLNLYMSRDIEKFSEALELKEESCRQSYFAIEI